MRISPALRRRDAEQHLGDLGAAGADQAEEAEDLAGAQLEAHVLDEDRAGQAARRRAPARRSSAVLLGEEGAGLGADHVAHGLLERQLGGRRG